MPSLFNFWSTQDRDVDMNDESTTPIPLKSISRPTKENPHDAAHAEPSTLPLAHLPTTTVRPTETDPLSIPSSSTSTVTPSSTPASQSVAMFAFSGKPMKPLKRSQGSGNERRHKLPSFRPGIQHLSQVEKTRLVEQQDLITRAEIDQKAKRINELETEVGG